MGNSTGAITIYNRREMKIKECGNMLKKGGR
jgi:hypothetical protein